MIPVHSDVRSDFISPIQYKVNTTCNSRFILISQYFAYANSRLILKLKIFK